MDFQAAGEQRAGGRVLAKADAHLRAACERRVMHRRGHAGDGHGFEAQQILGVLAREAGQREQKRQQRAGLRDGEDFFLMHAAR